MDLIKLSPLRLGFLLFLVFTGTILASKEIPLDGAFPKDSDIYQYIVEGKETLDIESIIFTFEGEKIIPEKKIVEEQYLLVGFLLDASGSLGTKGLLDLKGKVLELLGKLKTEDVKGIWSFADENKLEIELDKNNSIAAEEFIQNFKFRGSWTHLYDALVEVSKTLKDTSVNLNMTPVLILVTDGIDENSNTTLEEVQQEIDQSDIPLLIYIINGNKTPNIDLLSKWANSNEGSITQDSFLDFENWFQIKRSKIRYTFRKPPFPLALTLGGIGVAVLILGFLFYFLKIKKRKQDSVLDFDEQYEVADTLEIEEKKKSKSVKIVKESGEKVDASGKILHKSSPKMVSDRFSKLQSLRGSAGTQTDENFNLDDTIVRSRKKKSSTNRLNSLSMLRGDDAASKVSTEGDLQLSESIKTSTSLKIRNLDQLILATEELNGGSFSSSNIKLLLEYIYLGNIYWKDIFRLVKMEAFFQAFVGNKQTPNTSLDIPFEEYLYAIGEENYKGTIGSDEWNTYCESKYSEHIYLKNASEVKMNQGILLMGVSGRLARQSAINIQFKSGKFETRTDHVGNGIVRYFQPNFQNLNSKISLTSDILVQSPVHCKIQKITAMGSKRGFLYEVEVDKC